MCDGVSSRLCENHNHFPALRGLNGLEWPLCVSLALASFLGLVNGRMLFICRKLLRGSPIDIIIFRIVEYEMMGFFLSCVH